MDCSFGFSGRDKCISAKPVNSISKCPSSLTTAVGKMVTTDIWLGIPVLTSRLFVFQSVPVENSVTTVDAGKIVEFPHGAVNRARSVWRSGKIYFRVHGNLMMLLLMLTVQTDGILSSTVWYLIWFIISVSFLQSYVPVLCYDWSNSSSSFLKSHSRFQCQCCIHIL